MGSNIVSFYKGAPVFHISGNSSGSFLAIFLSDYATEDTLKHERGHGWQMLLMGFIHFTLTVAIQSPTQLGPWNPEDGTYRNSPWETLADILGDSIVQHTNKQKVMAWLHLIVTTICAPASYFFALGNW